MKDVLIAAVGDSVKDPEAKSEDYLLGIVDGVQDVDVWEVILMKIYEAEAARTIPGWERVIC